MSARGNSALRRVRRPARGALQGLAGDGAGHRRQPQEIGFLNITLNATQGWAWQSAFELVGPTS